jgi:hypothetical protein
MNRKLVAEKRELMFLRDLEKGLFFSCSITVNALIQAVASITTWEIFMLFHGVAL